MKLRLRRYALRSLFFLQLSVLVKHCRSRRSAESEIDVHFLLPVTARFVRLVDLNSLDKLMHLLGRNVRQMLVFAHDLDETVNVICLLLLGFDKARQLCDCGF